MWIGAAMLFYLGIGSWFFDYIDSDRPKEDLDGGFRMVPYVLFWPLLLIMHGVFVIIAFFAQCVEEIGKLFGERNDTP